MSACGQVVLERLVAYGLAAEARRQLHGPLEGPVGDHDAADAVALQVGDHQLRHLPGADRPGRCRSPRSPNTLRARSTDTEAMERELSPILRLGAHPLAHLERPAQQLVRAPCRSPPPLPPARRRSSADEGSGPRPGPWSPGSSATENRCLDGLPVLAGSRRSPGGRFGRRRWRSRAPRRRGSVQGQLPAGDVDLGAVAAC